MDDDDVAREVAEIQNCQLPSEEKWMLLSSYKPDDMVLAIEINQPTTSSTAHKPAEKLVQAKEAGDAIQDHRKDESPSLPSPQQSKAKRAGDPSIDDDVHPSKNSTAITSQDVQQQAMHSNPFQKGKNQDPEENTKVDRHHNLINVDESSETIEEPLSQENKQENVALGSEMNLKEKSESVNGGIEKDITFPQIDTSSSSSEIHPKDIAIQTIIKASSQVVPTKCPQWSMENKSYVITELNGNSNGEKDETIYPLQKAICRHCSILISQKSPVFNTKCKCTKTCLVHEGCKEAWSLEKGDKCSHCDQQIDCTRVELSSSEENHEITNSTSDRSWCCLC